MQITQRLKKIDGLGPSSLSRLVGKMLRAFVHPKRARKIPLTAHAPRMLRKGGTCFRHLGNGMRVRGGGSLRALTRQIRHVFERIMPY